MAQSDIRVGNNRYRIITKVGEGAFGDVYEGINVNTQEEVAIKLEHIRSKPQCLLYESKIYKILQGGNGIPGIFWDGVQGDFNCMVMEVLGPSLEELFVYSGSRFTIKTTALIADSIIERMEYLHNLQFIYRDIKPDNFLIGRGKKQTVIYLIDLGLVKRYKDPRSGQHIVNKPVKSLTGTVRYASSNAHVSEQSRRDDLEAIGYMCIYFLKGELPWQGQTGQNVESAIHEIKDKISMEELCQDCPKEFLNYMQYCKSLSFEDKPDYQYLRNLMKDCIIKRGEKIDVYLDWLMVKLNKPIPLNQYVVPPKNRIKDEDDDQY